MKNKTRLEAIFMAMQGRPSACQLWRHPPAIPFDGHLLVSHQDALLMGGKVPAPAADAGHVAFLYPEIRENAAREFAWRCATVSLTERGGQAICREKITDPALRNFNCR